MKRLVGIFLLMISFYGCAFLWDYKPHHVKDEGAPNPQKVIYDDDGVYVFIGFHLVDKMPAREIIKDSIYKYRIEAARFILKQDSLNLRKIATVDENYESIRNIKKEIFNYMVDIPESLITTQVIWKREYRKRVFLWFFKNVYDYQIKVYWPLYTYHKGIAAILEKHLESTEIPERAYSKLYYDYITGKIKVPIESKIE